MKLLKIEALDTLFFRDGKPFFIGEESVAETRTIPFPSVFWGAIFSKLWIDGAVRREDADKLTIGKIYLHDTNSFPHRMYLPAPADLFLSNKNKVFTESYISKSSDVFTSKNIQTKHFAVPNADSEAKSLKNACIDTRSLSNYANNNENLNIKFHENIFEYEYKIGIKKSYNTNRTIDAHLYSLPMFRFKEGWCYVIEYSIDTDDMLNDTGLLNIGGEGKAVRYSHDVEFKSSFSEDFDIQHDAEFKLYACSPVFIDAEKWRLISGDNTISLHSYIMQVQKEYEVLSVCHSDPIAVGGWDMKARRPKQMRQALPPGTIIKLKNTGGSKKCSIVKQELSALFSENDNKFGYNQFEIIQNNSI